MGAWGCKLANAIEWSVLENDQLGEGAIWPVGIITVVTCSRYKRTQLADLNVVL